MDVPLLLSIQISYLLREDLVCLSVDNFNLQLVQNQSLSGITLSLRHFKCATLGQFSQQITSPSFLHMYHFESH